MDRKKALGLIHVLVVILSWVYAFGCWSSLPDKFPTRFDFSGEVTEYGSKNFINVYGLPVLMTVLGGVFLFAGFFSRHYNVPGMEKLDEMPARFARPVRDWMGAMVLLLGLFVQGEFFSALIMFLESAKGGYTPLYWIPVGLALVGIIAVTVVILSRVQGRIDDACAEFRQSAEPEELTFWSKRLSNGSRRAQGHKPPRRKKRLGPFGF